MEFNATFIAAAISFGIFTIIMNAIFYKPLSNVVAQRQKFIDDTNEDAKIKTSKSETILKDKNKKLETTKHDARKVITDKSEEVKAKKADLTSEAQKTAGRKVECAKGEMQKSSEEAQGVLSEEAKKLAENISAKILSET